ncbi:unnamed protein product, partial [Amoebophrya sp. A25]
NYLFLLRETSHFAEYEQVDLSSTCLEQNAQHLGIAKEDQMNNNVVLVAEGGGKNIKKEGDLVVLGPSE